MSKISNDKILEVFLEISKGTASKRKLESITGVSRKRIAAFMSMLSSKGYKPNDVLNFTEEELTIATSVASCDIKKPHRATLGATP